MEKVGSVYKEWIRYLIKKKRYGTWMRDLAIIANNKKANNCYYWNYDYYCNNYVNVNHDVLTINKSSINQYLPLASFIIQCNSKFDMKFWLKQFSDLKKFYICGFGGLSTFNWRHEYDEFEKETNRNCVLSRNLSRKMYRANNKVSSGRIKEKQIQPWYSKSYEKQYKNIWRK